LLQLPSVLASGSPQLEGAGVHLQEGHDLQDQRQESQEVQEVSLRAMQDDRHDRGGHPRRRPEEAEVPEDAGKAETDAGRSGGGLPEHLQHEAGQEEAEAGGPGFESRIRITYRRRSRSSCRRRRRSFAENEYRFGECRKASVELPNPEVVGSTLDRFYWFSCHLTHQVAIKQLLQYNR